MGTRSLTEVLDFDGAPIVTMYRQFDGYPSGHGVELAKFLAKKRIINGIRMNDKEGECFNGPGCLAASVVMHFKKDHPLGGIYLYKPGSRGVGEEYIYTVVPNRDGTITVSIREV